LGQRMVLRGDDDPHHVERLAGYVKRKVDEVSTRGPVTSSKIALLAALNIADDYFRALEETREIKRQVALKSRALLAELEG
jgi:cell division protein ZapA (FtsZ GTPase activity inhibitor)